MRSLILRGYMGGKAQKRLSRVLALVVAAGLSRPLNNASTDVPEQRDIKDDIEEAALEGAVRMTSVFIASVLVRRLARGR